MVKISEAVRENFLIQVLGEPHRAMLSSICYALTRESEMARDEIAGSSCGRNDHAIVGSKILISKKRSTARVLAWDLSCIIFLSVSWTRQWSARSSSLQITPKDERPADMLESKAAFQRDPSGLEEWAKENLGIFSKEKSQLLPQGRKNPCCSLGWGGIGWGEAPQEWSW